MLFIMSLCLYHMYRMDKLDMVKYLVENSNVDITIKDELDRTPLDCARG